MNGPLAKASSHLLAISSDEMSVTSSSAFNSPSENLPTVFVPSAL